LQNQIEYLNKRLNMLVITNKADRKNKKALQRKINDQKTRLTSCSQVKNRTISPSRNSKFFNNKKLGREPSLSYQVNIRAMLLTFYCGTGGFDVGSFVSFFGIPGGGSWERTFHRKSGVVHKIILDLCDLVLAESLKK